MENGIGSIISDLVGADSWVGNGIMATRVRDLVTVELGGRSLVIACDSNAATGDKPGDHLKQDPIVTGYSAAKVPLMEVLAAGAAPFLLVNNLCCDLATTGVRILRGIRDLLEETGVDVMVTGSDESNMPTVQTGVGVTVIGIAATSELRLGTIMPGDELWVVGRRRSGVGDDDYEEGVDGVATALHVKSALALGDVHEVLPVGSRGIAFEAGELARVGNVRLELKPDTLTDLRASAGASTCFLVACAPAAAERLAGLGLPRERVADVHENQLEERS